MFKKIIFCIAIISFLFMIAGCSCAHFNNTNNDNSDQPYAESFEGEGTSENPYRIANLNNLLYLANSVNNEKNSYQNKYFLLTEDIDMNGYDWIPIGKKDAWSQNNFMGNFNGDGHTISNYCITKNWSFAAGLFASCENSTLSNIIIKNATIELSVGHNIAEAGLLVGAAKSCKIFNCITEGSIYITSDAAQQNIGGIVGDLFVGSPGTPIIKNCKSKIEIATNGPYPNVGGIVGRTTNVGVVDCEAKSNIKYASNMAAASGGSYNGIGGLIGVNLGADVRDCSVETSILGGAGIWRVGGLIGYSEWADIENCHVRGSIRRHGVSADTDSINDSLISSGGNNNIGEDCTCNIICEYI